ncbi:MULTISPECIES: TrkH family potassium uptake protein [unclassified Dehalobacter]|uniref:TrkH family potassium uptake protein n=1 Tax=unclassified Dehalobacter TaxID=2635733 RepID=UPI00028A9D2E|nr:MULTISPECIES: TrkH family potassium uptake protein [unclassified Dehalobacter]AFV01043.1 Potassium uptake protein, integral membrane component, KtrB [Dehalobacter sp. DCA]AFV04082.1 Potassium uptake protein, integral membrane component, KtrB [Dehalobacter sp. CF]
MNDIFKIDINTPTTQGKKKLSPPQILAIGFISVILVGTLLLSLSIATVNGKGLPFIDALFTATSAVCVTGLVVVDTGSVFSVFGQIVILLLIQIGGLGFMTFATFFAILLGKKINLQERMILQEAYNQSSLEGIVRLAKYIFLAAFLIEAIGIIILTIRWSFDFNVGKAFYYALFHTVSAFNNAGFDLFGNSLMRFQRDIVINLTVMVLIVLGGIGFSVISDVYFQRGRKMSLHSWIVIRTTGLLIAIGAILFFLLEFNNPDTLGNLGYQGKILSSLFQSVTPRTAGFNTIDISALQDTTILLMIVFMFIGASPGSTGGGIKTTTFVAIMLSIFSIFRNKSQVTIHGRSIPKEVIQKAVAIMTLAIIWIILVTGLLSITEEADLITLLFETVSAFGTVGLSLGITSDLTLFGKILIILTMFVGRVGLLTIAFSIGKGNNPGNQAKYPESKIMIG